MFNVCTNVNFSMMKNCLNPYLDFSYERDIWPISESTFLEEILKLNF